MKKYTMINNCLFFFLKRTDDQDKTIKNHEKTPSFLYSTMSDGKTQKRGVVSLSHIKREFLLDLVQQYSCSEPEIIEASTNRKL